MLAVGRAALGLPRKRGLEKGKSVGNFVGSTADTKGRKPFRGGAGRGERGQVLIIVILAMPLFVALIALVADGSSVFANKRRVQNAADSIALAVAQDLPKDGSQCTGPDTTSGTCLFKLRTDAQSYSNSNGGSPTTIQACNDSVGPIWNCYVTPYKGQNSSVQIRIKRTIRTYFAGSLGFLNTSSHATAAVGIGGPASAAGNVSPIGIDKSKWSADLLNVSGTKLDFDQSGFALFDESHVCPSGSTLAFCSPSGPIVAGTACNRSSSNMNNDIRYGYPGDHSTVVLPVNAWYCDNNGAKGGVKQGLQDDYSTSTTLLIPVFDSAFTPPSGSPTSYHVVGFAAFVIEQDPKVTWSGSPTSGTHYLIGHYTTFIAVGVSGGSGGAEDFGVKVVTLSE
jgi:hypothetical protein